MIAPEIRTVITQMEKALVESLGKFLGEPAPDTHYQQIMQQLRVIIPDIKSQGYEVRGSSIVMLFDRENSTKMIESFGWDAVHEMMRAGTMEVEIDNIGAYNE